MNPVYNNDLNKIIPIAPATSYTVPKKTEIERKKRTRAKRSCDFCRKKKTRCDSEVNQPCTKCKLANADCTFLVEQKKRGPSTGNYVSALENRLLRMEKLLQNIAKEKDAVVDLPHESIVHAYSRTTDDTLPEIDDNEAEDEIENDSPSVCKAFEHHDTFENADDNYDFMQKKMRSLTISDYQRTRFIGASSGVHFLNEGFFSNNKKHRLPEDPDWFVQKLNDDEEEHVLMKTKEILAHQVDVLNDGGALDHIAIFEDTPYITQEFADYLIHLYFTRIHAHCPIINKVQFLEQYYFHSPCPPDKYILFAITYISTTIFKNDISKSKVFNYSDEQISEMQKSLNAKSHKLLSVVYKRSMISTVQALMLLSMFSGYDGEDEDEDSGCWFITGMAIRMAQDLGLHRDCSKWLIPDYEIELRKRIWYCAYLMDRWVAAQLGQPISINDSEFEVGLPTPYELNYSPNISISSLDFAPVLILEADEASKQKLPVYSSFIHLVTLSQIMGQVLVGLHSSRAKQQSRNSSLDLVNILDRNLTNWKKSLPRELQVDLGNPNHIFTTKASVVNMAYCCVLLLLYRPFIRQEANKCFNIAFKAFSICTATATNLISIIEATERDQFVALPWNMSVYLLFQAAIIFLHNAKGENQFIKEQGIRYLIRCSKVYLDDPFLKNTRIVKVVQRLARSFDVPMTECQHADSPISSFEISVGNSRKRDEPHDYEFAAPYSTNEHDSYICDAITQSLRNYHHTEHLPILKHSKTSDNNNSTSSNFTIKAGSLNGNGNQRNHSPSRTPSPHILNPFETCYPEGHGAEALFLSSLTVGLDKNNPLDNQTVETQQQAAKKENNNVLFDFSNNHQDPILCPMQNEQQLQEALDLGPNCPTTTTTNIGSTVYSSNSVNSFNNSNNNNCDILKPSPNAFSNTTTPESDLNIHNDSQRAAFQQQPSYLADPTHQPFDFSSLNSDVPVWDIPSGISLHEWDLFLKANVYSPND